MRSLFTALLVATAVFLCLRSMAQTPPPAANPLGAIASAAGQAALTAATQAAGQQATTLLSTGQAVGIISTVYLAVGSILSGLQQLLGLGARSKQPKVASVSAKALTVVQHLAGAPNITPPSS